MSAAPATDDAPPPPAEGMTWVPGGTFLMGSEDFYPEERPVRATAVEGFWMDERPVTVREFRRFVKQTGYVTLAERPLDAADYPEADPALLVPGSLVFHPTPGPVDLRLPRLVAYVPGACWHRPEGPGSDTYTRATPPGRRRSPTRTRRRTPTWAGKALPTEAEWERAARGGLEGEGSRGATRTTPDGQLMANCWQGEFPWQNLRLDGTRHVAGRLVPANGYGLYDMTGNVWEWTCDLFDAGAEPASPCRVPAAAPGRFPRHVIKGGSHLCAPNYCLRYRPAARQSEAVDTSTSHLGLRCIVRAGGS